jgi:DNA-binding beta-propeller fold protein YncE
VEPRPSSRVVVFLVSLLLTALILGIPGIVAGSGTGVTTSIALAAETGATAGTASVAAGQGTGTIDRNELERRLTLLPFAYVAETDIDAAKIQKGLDGYSGAAAFIDSSADALIARPGAGSSLQEVAVAPDGSRCYVTDAYEPVLHVFDCETREEILKIPLPGVKAHDPTWMMGAFQSAGGKFPYAQMRSCSSGVACSPDGSMVLVCSSAGLQVVDTATNTVVRTLPDLLGGLVALSFDGTRAYVACDTFDKLAPRSFLDWFKVIMESEECRFVCIDLATWQVVKEIPTPVVAGIAVKPDDSQVFFSEAYKKRVQVVDALTLEDLWDVSTEPSYAIGIGFPPDGTKAYVVCSADSGLSDAIGQQQTVPTMPKAEDFFCAVINTAGEEIVKRIPLEAY